MSEVKLKPCPFCGGEAEIVKAHNSFPLPYLVVCKADGCSASFGNFKRTKDEAVRAWNTRKPMNDIVERLEEHKSYNQMMLKKFPKMGTIENAIYKTQRDTYENAIEIVKGGVKD